VFVGPSSDVFGDVAGCVQHGRRLAHPWQLDPASRRAAADVRFRMEAFSAAQAFATSAVPNGGLQFAFLARNVIAGEKPGGETEFTSESPNNGSNLFGGTRAPSISNGHWASRPKRPWHPGSRAAMTSILVDEVFASGAASSRALSLGCRNCITSVFSNTGSEWHGSVAAPQAARPLKFQGASSRGRTFRSPYSDVHLQKASTSDCVLWCVACGYAPRKETWIFS